MSLSKQRIKLINSLKQKKYRQKYGFFIAEGQNIAKELAKDQGCHYTILEAYYSRDESSAFFIDCNSHQISSKELKKISFLKNPVDCVMLLKIPESLGYETMGSLSFYLDGIQDPGNMGTIIRIANWFGIDAVIRSFDSVDFYNPKVIQASMGGFISTSLLNDDGSLLKIKEYRKIALQMNGDRLDQLEMTSKTICIIGNEGQGISDTVQPLIDQFVSILSNNPKLSIDSLNAAVSAGIFAGFMRI